MASSKQAAYPPEFSTVNGLGYLIAETWVDQADAHVDSIPDGYLVRHPKGAQIDLELCAKVLSKSGISGWLVVYKKETK